MKTRLLRLISHPNYDQLHTHNIRRPEIYASGVVAIISSSRDELVWRATAVGGFFCTFPQTIIGTWRD